MYICAQLRIFFLVIAVQRKKMQQAISYYYWQPADAALIQQLHIVLHLVLSACVFCFAIVRLGATGSVGVR